MKSDPTLEEWHRSVLDPVAPWHKPRSVSPSAQIQLGGTATNVALPTLPSEINRGAFSKVYGTPGAPPRSG